MSLFFRILILSALSAAFVGAGAFAKHPVEPLTISQLKRLKKDRCTFVHFWATWCTICIQELPSLSVILDKTPEVRTVIVDTSDPFVQKNFSQAWVQTFPIRMTTYVRPGGDEKSYVRALDAGWNGMMPHSLLFQYGKLRKTWRGALDRHTIAAELRQLCKK